MGSGPSQEEIEEFGLYWYKLASESTCFLPDVSIDESLVKYSGINSNSELLSYSNGLVNSVPGFVEKLGSAFGALTAVPNAVGIGALVISMIMEIIMKSSQTSESSYSMLRRVFGEEKASSVRDTMSEYLKRHHLNIYDDQRLLEETKILERQLSNQLTILRNSMLHDGQMSTRGFKIWVNGASFHLQILIHEARLEIQAGKPDSVSAYKAKAAIVEYSQHLDTLLEEFKTYMISSTETSTSGACGYRICTGYCNLTNKEARCNILVNQNSIKSSCVSSKVSEPYVNHIFSNYEPITSLKPHFTNIKNNVDALIKQHDSFTLPSQ